MQLSVVLPVAVTVLLAAAGYWVTYLTNLRLARRKDRLDRVNRQLSELYGPMYALFEASDRAWRDFTSRREFLGRAGIWGAIDAEATEEEAAEWRLWMTTVFMPLNRRMMESVVTHADLLREDALPECLKDLLAHVACYEPIVSRWQEDGFDSRRAIDHVSVAGNYPYRALEAYLSGSFNALKQEQARLLAQIQHA